MLDYYDYQAILRPHRPYILSFLNLMLYLYVGMWGIPLLSLEGGVLEFFIYHHYTTPCLRNHVGLYFAIAKAF